MNKIISSLAIVALLLSACGQKTESNTSNIIPSPKTNASESIKPSPSNGFKKYTIKSEGITIEHPDTWVLGDSSQLNVPSAKAIFYDSKSNKDFTTNMLIEVVTHPLLAPSARILANTTNDLMAISGPSMGLSAYKEVSFEDKKYGKYNAGILTGTYKIAQTDLSVKVLQYYIPIKNKSYTLTLTTSENSFDTYKPQFEKIINSFEIAE